MPFQRYSTERISAELYGGVTAYKIEVRMEHGVATQKHTYYDHEGTPLAKNLWIPSPFTVSELKKEGSGFSLVLPDTRTTK
jgi:hypothetical protein